MKATQSTAAQGDNSGGGAVANAWTIPLPHAARGNDARLRSIVANLLALPGVRSVVIDREQTQATANFRPYRRRLSGVVEIPTSVFLEPVADDNDAERGGESALESIVSWTNPSDGAMCFIALPPSARGFRRALLLAAAAGTLTLGLAGIVLPGLPTTPFVLVASYCLLRSSPRLHERLLQTRLFGGVLRDWYLHRGLRPHVRYKAIAVIVLVLGASLLLTSLPLAVKLTIAAIAAIGIGYVWRLPNVLEQVSNRGQ